MNIGKRPALPGKPKLLEIPEETALLVNLTDVAPPIVSRTYGNFSIPGCVEGRQQIRDRGELVYDEACERGEEWAGERIHAARAVMDFGKDYPKNEFIVHASEIANDLALTCNGELWGIGTSVTGKVEDTIVRGFAGVFVASADFPAEEELRTARELLHASDAELVGQANQTYAQFGPQGVRAISGAFKEAAKRLNLDAEWMHITKNLPECPHCGSKLKSLKATVCATCGRDVVATAEEEAETVEAKKPAAAKRGRAKSKAAAAVAA